MKGQQTLEMAGTKIEGSGREARTEGNTGSAGVEAEETEKEHGIEYKNNRFQNAPG